MTGKQNAPEIRFEGFTDPWEQRKLGSIAASFDYGLNAAATEYDGQNKYLRITDVDDTTHEFLKSDLTTPLADLAMSADYLLEEGDLLFARTGASVGKNYLYRQYDGTVYFAGFLIRARIGESADPEFVYQATLTDAYKKYVAITSQRSGQPGVNAQEYADYQLMLPSRTEQQQIGMTLRSLDNLITLHQRKYDKLCTVKKSMLDKMFPKPGETEPEIRFEGFTDPWEQRKFSDVAVIRRGLTYSPTNIVDGADGVRVLRSSNINEDHFVLNDDDVFVDESAVNIDLVHDGDILITAANGSPRLVGKRARISDLPGKTVHGGFMLVASSPCSDFLCASMGSSWYRRFLATGVAGGNGAIGNLDSKALGETIIAVPNDAEIDKLGNFFTRLDSLITLHQREPRFADTG